MKRLTNDKSQDRQHIGALAARAGRLIPPLWPLASSVAVNPFLGHADEPLHMAASRLLRLTGESVFMPPEWYRSHLGPERGRATSAHHESLRRIPALAEICAQKTGVNWPDLVEERFSAWAAGYLDEGQALWPAPRGRNAYDAWRAHAQHDLVPEILGLQGFARFVADLPDEAERLLEWGLERAGVPIIAAESYFHQLLLSLGGWAQYARFLLWQEELQGRTDATLMQMLAIRFAWDLALLDRFGTRVTREWQDALAAHAEPVRPSAAVLSVSAMQEELERREQDLLAKAMAADPVHQGVPEPWLHTVFCIDVRSEIMRRALESLDTGVRTSGFAGFFGLGVNHRAFASDLLERRLPVLLNPSLGSCDGRSQDAGEEVASRISARGKRAWGRFRQAAVSSFAYVEAAGPVYAARLVADTLGLKRGQENHSRPAPCIESPLSVHERTDAAEAILRAMSMVDRFARLVILVGHGSTTVNNPHASALHCGACGGYPGDVNARLVADLLNDAAVRKELGLRGLRVPEETRFIGGLHDTSTDRVSLFSQNGASPQLAADIARARTLLERASHLSRSERVLRLPGAAGPEQVLQRSRDWSETRPEWGLAGCAAFIAAPRERTRGRNLEGRAFLHDYEWRHDTGFGVLELILTAPVVVASWISLQYYGSAVAPALFGSGSKVLHNVVGGIGVLEGAAGPLRGGLPWQSVHDGQGLAHLPVRLSVCVEAPRQAISDVLARHESVRTLFDNGWLYLFAMDDAGRLAWKYAGELTWSRTHYAADDRETAALKETA